MGVDGMERQAWHRKNLEEINRRLQWLRDKPEGVLYEKKTAFNRAVVVKKGSQIHLYFTGFRAGTGEPRMSGVMSRIDLDDPLDLPAVYTQAMMLTLLWREDPERICMLGYGGGRIAMVFHHFLPEVVIDCVEIDPDIVDLSEVFFGVKPGGRLRVFVQDAREFVETLPGGTRYDNPQGSPSPVILFAILFRMSVTLWSFLSPTIAISMPSSFATSLSGTVSFV